jgi:hypothetical protein
MNDADVDCRKAEAAADGEAAEPERGPAGDKVVPAEAIGCCGYCTR